MSQTTSPDEIARFRTACGATIHVNATLGPIALTPCCEGAVKYREASDGHERLYCKGCGTEKAAEWGGVGRVQIMAAISETWCPVPYECVDHTIWQASLYSDDA